jgi:ribonuclease HI
MKLWVDGATTETCFVLEGQEPVVVPTEYKVTNNVGEYHALIRGLQEAKAQGIENLEVLSDSQLVMNQLRLGRDGKPIYACKNERLRSLRQITLDLMGEFNSVVLRWVKREQSLAGIELDRRKRKNADAKKSLGSRR